MLQNHPTMSQTAAPGNAGGYVRGGYMPGGFYGKNPASVNPNMPASVSEGNPTPPIMNTLGGNSPPRPPPPPYPVGYSDVDMGSGQGPEVDSGSWHPQRPKSLPLGNSSKKKTSNNKCVVVHTFCSVHFSNICIFVVLYLVVLWLPSMYSLLEVNFKLVLA